MTLSYSSYDEVWDESLRKPKGKKRMDPACALYKKKDGRNKVYDNIIDSYLETDGSYTPVESSSSYASDSRDVQLHTDAMELFELTKRQSKGGGTPYPKPQPTYDEMSNTMESTTAQNAMEYERYYEKDNMFQQKLQNEHCHTIHEAEEEMSEEAIHQETIRSMRTHIQPTETPPIRQAYRASNMIDLALYVISGIFLIFIMEQILYMGTLLR